MSAFVVAVSGPPGSGKSTLARALGRSLGAPVLVYDAYERITAWPPEAVADWLARGAPFAEVPLPGLAEDLAALRAGRPVPDRAEGGTLRPSPGPRPCLVLDTLLGRGHAETGRLIDHLLWLDVPADVALARKLRAILAEGGRDPRAAPALVAGLDAYLARYPDLLRATYAVQERRVRPGADRVLDALAAPDALAEAARASIAAALSAGEAAP